MNNDGALQQLEHIRDFQIADLRKADRLAGANFLVCVGCFNATELLGGLEQPVLLEDPDGKVAERLKRGIAVLGLPYQKYEQDLVALRHSMTHSYRGQAKNYPHVDITNDRDPLVSMFPLGVQDLGQDEKLVVNVTAWTSDLENAWTSTLARLRKDVGHLDEVRVALDQGSWLR